MATMTTMKELFGEDSDPDELSDVRDAQTEPTMLSDAAVLSQINEILEDKAAPVPKWPSTSRIACYAEEVVANYPDGKQVTPSHPVSTPQSPLSDFNFENMLLAPNLLEVYASEQREFEEAFAALSEFANTPEEHLFTARPVQNSPVTVADEEIYEPRNESISPHAEKVTVPWKLFRIAMPEYQPTPQVNLDARRERKRRMDAFLEDSRTTVVPYFQAKRKKFLAVINGKEMQVRTYGDGTMTIKEKTRS